jgi:intracellular sulfur oxidation DsrE/DsrF family protein
MREVDASKTDVVVSDELLNSFVDNELSAADRDRTFARVHADDEVGRTVCELRGVGELVRHAYEEPPPPQTTQDNTGNGRAAMRMVACVAFCTVVGSAFVLAWNAFDPHLRVGTGTAAPSGPVADLGASGVVASGSAPAVEPARILMHLSSGDQNRITEVLDEAEATARYYASQNRPSLIEVIANGDGIVLLLAASHEYSERVRALQAHYPNLRFSACRNTLERYARNGLDTHLQPNVGIVESGVAEIIRRQRDGWAYLRV